MYKHFISLGSFCSVAGELERFGLRDASYPFDWLVSDFKNVINLINNKFYDFLNEKRLKQNTTLRSVFADELIKMYFFHDFNKYEPLEKQMPKVREKYERRINRFYEAIKEPTLFFRYIYHKKDAGEAELLWIEDNIDCILRFFKSFNADSDIIFIANEGFTSNKIKIYNVPIDTGDVVCRSFGDHNVELKYLLENIECENKSENLKFYLLKEKRKNSIGFKVKRKLKGIFSRCRKIYIHSQTYDTNLQLND